MGVRQKKHIIITKESEMKLISTYFTTMAISLLCIFPGHLYAASAYSITDIGFIQASLGRNDIDINNSGQISLSNGYIYNNGQATYLGNLGGTTPGGTTSTRAFALNDNGQVVGISSTPNGRYRAFKYDNGNINEIGTLGDLSSADDINNNGHVVGTYENESRNTRAFVYKNGTISDIGTLGKDFSTANAINDNGQIVGRSLRNDGSFVAYIYENGVMRDLGLGGVHNSAADINNIGQIVGSIQHSINGVQYLRPYLYSEGALLELGTLGGQYANATSINDNSQIVGTTSTSSGQKAFLYEDDQVTDLNNLIKSDADWVLTSAYSINNSGQIVGFGKLNGETHAYLLTPVPLPGAYVLFFSGFILLTYAGRFVKTSV